MEKKIKKITWNGETIDLPCPIYIDTDELNKKFANFEYCDMLFYVFMKSVEEWIKKNKGKE